jgi:hypothetical protein
MENQIYIGNPFEVKFMVVEKFHQEKIYQTLTNEKFDFEYDGSNGFHWFTVNVDTLLQGASVEKIVNNWIKI